MMGFPISEVFCFRGYCVENTYVMFTFFPIFILLFWFVFKDFVKFQNKEDKKGFRQRNRQVRIFVLVLRSLILIFLLLTIARPYETIETTTLGQPVIKVAVDSSESMKVFRQDTLERLKARLEGDIPIEVIQVSAGYQSAIGDGLIKHIDGEDNILLISDGNNNKGKILSDVGVYANLLNSRIFGLELEGEGNDAYVKIIGPSETIENTLNRYLVKVEFVGATPAYTLQVYVDDKLEYSGQNANDVKIEKSFVEGSHKIMAKIEISDLNSGNNIFMKSVKTVKKPKVLLVRQSPGAFETGINDLYHLTARDSLPLDISSYSAIIFNDVDGSKINPRIEDLTGFLLEGKGLLFIGGRHSYDKGGYKDTLLEAMLPVKIGAGRVVDPLQHNIIIVMDVSDSFSDFSFRQQGGESALDLGKGMAVKMAENFRDDINVGLVAFATYGQIVQDPVRLGDGRETLISKIERLRGGEGTSISNGLIFAKKALETVKGTKNVILISDGKMPGRSGLDPSTMNKAREMAAEGIRIYTVGMPSVIEGQTDIDRDMMTELARIGGGSYFEPNEFQFLNVFFGKPEAKEKIFSGKSNLVVMDEQHFITADLKRDLLARITGLNFVAPKSGSKGLIFTGDGNPVLVSWNFGTGRVVSFATDDGREWAGEVLTKDNSMLLTRMINYVIGNPESEKDIIIDANDGYIGESIDINVISDKYPVSKDITFVKTSKNHYKAEFVPTEPGFYSFFDSFVAVNSPRELFALGFNDDLREMVSLSGGEMINMDDEGLLEKIESKIERRELVRKDLRLWPLAFVLALFLIEILIRKIFEHKKFKVIK